MSISPLVSIVIPVFNGEKYIKEAIDSVLKQDYPNLELIVLDDGSEDNTLEIIKKYKGKFYWETHTNIGQADTLNKGWQLAKGDLLSYLSADDTLMQNAVRTSVKCLNSNPDVVLTYCDFNLIDPESKVIRRVNPPDYNYRDMVVKIICHPGPGVFFSRRAFEATGYWNSDYKQMPDYDYWIRLGLVGKFCHIPELLASFRIHSESQSFAKGNESKSEEPLRIISAYFQRSDIPEEIISAKNEALSNAYLTSAQLHWRAGRYKKGFNRAKEAIKLHPRNLWSKRTLRLTINALANRFLHQALWKLRNLSSKSNI
jgi:glycosyltransferase involved in cell wall biosynthesis